MPLSQADIELRLSGGATNTNPNASLGGTMSSQVLITDEINNAWDDISGIEASIGDVEYRCFYVVNKSTQFYWRDVRIWVSQQTPSATEDVAIGLGVKPATATSGITFDEQLLVDESTTPSGVAFSTISNNSADALSLNDIPPGYHKGIWVKRTVLPGTESKTDNYYVLRIEGTDQ